MERERPTPQQVDEARVDMLEAQATIDASNRVRETSHTGPTYAPSKHTKCAKTQKLIEKSNISPIQ